MRILVAGGAGYIGSHMNRLLLEAGHGTTVLDDLSNGWRDAVRGGRFVRGDLGDRGLLERVFEAGRFDAVMHFASCIQVGESVTDPAKYYRNNVSNTTNLLDAMTRHGVLRLIFSSTAAVFGEPRAPRLTEDSATSPSSPYGRSKLMVEQILGDYDRAYGLRHSSLRYFNAAGADPDGTLGERHEPETHLIPLALRAAAGTRGALGIFGADYDTPDGTCVRDYVHVADLCRAHLLALQRLADGGASRAYNLGNGDGYSVAQVIETVRRVTGRPVPVTYAPRREGDSARLVADATRARQELDWQPQFAALETIISHAWNWERRQEAASGRAAVG
jgi:UDP-glucose 4-epimerase